MVEPERMPTYSPSLRVCVQRSLPHTWCRKQLRGRTGDHGQPLLAVAVLIVVAEAFTGLGPSAFIGALQFRPAAGGHFAAAFKTAAQTDVADSFRWADSFAGRPRARVMAAVSAEGDGVPAPAASAFIADDWASKANELVQGLMPDLTPLGREYSALTRTYFDTAKKPKPSQPRPWKTFGEGEAWVPGGDPADDPDANEADQRHEDFVAAMEFFGEEATGQGIAIDVGCGDGYMARRLVKSGNFSRVFAFDVEWMQLEMARNSAEQRGLGPDQGLLLARCDAQSMPLRHASVDAAWMGMGLHYVQDAGEVLRSIAMSLKPGGRLLATTIAGAMTADSLEEKAKAAGFSDVDVRQPRGTELVLRATK